jgi:hypothetical protein
MQQWDITNSVWINFYQLNYSNNSQGNIEMVVMQIWDTNSSIWENSQQITISYLLDIKDIALAEKTSIYPNPASEKITISTQNSFSDSKYFIRNQLGQNVINGNLLGAETVIPIELLPSGIYYIQLENKSSLKLIKQ